MGSTHGGAGCNQYVSYPTIIPHPPEITNQVPVVRLGLRLDCATRGAHQEAGLKHYLPLLLYCTNLLLYYNTLLLYYNTLLLYYTIKLPYSTTTQLLYYTTLLLYYTTLRIDYTNRIYACRSFAHSRRKPNPPDNKLTN